MLCCLRAKGRSRAAAKQPIKDGKNALAREAEGSAHDSNDTTDMHGVLPHETAGVDGATMATNGDARDAEDSEPHDSAAQPAAISLRVKTSRNSRPRKTNLVLPGGTQVHVHGGVYVERA